MPPKKQQQQKQQKKIYLSKAEYDKDLKAGLIPGKGPNAKGKGKDQQAQNNKNANHNNNQKMGKGAKGGKGAQGGKGGGKGGNRGNGGRENNNRMRVDPAPYQQPQQQQTRRVVKAVPKPISERLSGVGGNLAAQIATAQAIIVAGGHPKRAEVRQLLEVREKGWIEDAKFGELLQNLLF